MERAKAVARILYVQFANPAAYPPISHGANILAEAGADVRIVGTRPRIADAIRLPRNSTIRVTRIPEASGVMQKVAYACFLAAALAVAMRQRPDWIYVSDALAAPVGIVLRALTGARVVYHEHDIPTGPSTSAFARLCLAARAALVRSGDLVAVPSPGRASHLREHLSAGDVRVVMNCPRRADVREPAAPVTDTLRLAYHGTIVRERVPLALADALGMLQGRAVLTLAGYEPPGAAGWVSALTDRVSSAGARGAIRYAGVLPLRAELLQLCATADAGLALVPTNDPDPNMQSMAGASNKAFDYLASGVPVIVADRDDWRAMFVDAGYAIPVVPDDPRSIAAALEWMMDHRMELRAMGAAGRMRVERDWNYEAQFAELGATLLGGRPRTDKPRRRGAVHSRPRSETAR